MIKVEQKENGKVTEFTFTCNSSDDHETLDKLRVAFFGDHPRRGGMKDSNTLVVETIIPQIQLS